MLDTLHHPHAGLLLFLAVPQVEGHGAVALADLAEELPASFHLEHVSQPGLLEYCRLGVLLLILPVPGTEQNVHGVHLVLLKLVDLAVLGLTLQTVVDGLFPVNDILLQVVGDHPLHRLTQREG